MSHEIHDNDPQQSNDSEYAIEVSLYSAESIQVLTSMEAIQKRPAMYVGDLTRKGLHRLCLSTIHECATFMHELHLHRLEVTLHDDFALTIRVPGLCLPLEESEHELDMSHFESMMSMLYAGVDARWEFAKDNDLFLLGWCVTNALSERFEAMTCWQERVEKIVYERGERLSRWRFDSLEGAPETVLYFRADSELFSDVQLKAARFVDELQQLSKTLPGSIFCLRDECSREQMMYLFESGWVSRRPLLDL